MSDLQKSATANLKFSEDGRAFIQGSRCSKCGTTYLGEREHCANCTERNSMDLCELSETGRLYNYTIVHRSYPGVSVPFVSAIVDLDDGSTIKGNLLDVDPSPEALEFDMPVKLVYRGAELANAAGEGYLAYFFVPAGDAE